MSNISKLCEKYNITDYSINGDGSIDVYSTVDLTNKKLKKIPIKFNRVIGNFFISYNLLEDLENCPKSIYGNFDCDHNKLITLKGCPFEVWGDFYCSYNEKLTSIDYLTKHISGKFHLINTGVDYIYTESKIQGDIFYDRHLNGLKFSGYKITNWEEWLLSEKRKSKINKIINKNI